MGADSEFESLLSSFLPTSLFLLRPRLPLLAFEEFPMDDVDRAESHVCALFYAVREAFEVPSCLLAAPPFLEALEDCVLLED